MSEKKVTNYVVKLTKEQIKKLENILLDRGWDISSFQYAYWRAMKDKTTIVAYNSGKVTIQGRGTEEFITFTLEPEITKEVKFGYEAEEKSSKSINNTNILPLPHAGIDESGKGDFFGPLVIACAYVDETDELALQKLGVQDSKNIKSDIKMHKMSLGIRDILYGKYAIISIGNEAYNKMYENIDNLNKLLAWGHSRALENLLKKVPHCDSVIADKFGNNTLIKRALMEQGKKVRLVQETKAERDIAVAAASILARDEFVQKLKTLGNLHKMELPKGCSQKVEKVVAQLLKRDGEDKFAQYAKLHFKTLNKVKSKIGYKI